MLIQVNRLDLIQACFFMFHVEGFKANGTAVTHDPTHKCTFIFCTFLNLCKLFYIYYSFVFCRSNYWEKGIGRDGSSWKWFLCIKNLCRYELLSKVPKVRTSVKSVCVWVCVCVGGVLRWWVLMLVFILYQATKLPSDWLIGVTN